MCQKISWPRSLRTLANTPNYVGAFERNGNALIVLGGGGPPGDPSGPAETFIATIKKTARMEPAESEALKIGDWPAHLVRFEDTSGTEPVSIYYLWVASRGMTFQVIAIGTDEYREQLANAARSMRNLTKEERESIYGYQIWIAEAEQHESLGQLSARADNAIDEEVIAAINAIPADAELQEGDVVKVVRKEYYGR